MIIPVYRVEKYIGRFAESVFEQSYPHIQLIFVDDETDDASMNILSSMLRNEYPHLKDKVHLVRQPHAGLPSARKTGLEYAQGDYIWHLDSDDWVEKDAAEKIAECAGRTDADIIYFDFYREMGNRTVLERERDYDSSQMSLYQRHIYDHRAYGCVWNKCVKRTLYQEHVIHFSRYSHAEDAFLMSQLVGYASGIFHLKEALYHYRKDNPNALTKQGRKIRTGELIRNFLCLCELCQDVPDNPVQGLVDDIYYRAGRYSLIYGLGLFDEYPYLAEKILAADISGGRYVSVPMQILLKMHSRLRRLK